MFDRSSEVSSLYIHWPFCPYKCHFCPFVAIASHDEYMERYHEALIKEIQLYAAYAHNTRIKTLFFGGGTPSTYPPALLLDTFGILRNTFDKASDAEITLEVNPGTITQHKIETWKEVGITRLSIGVQSLNDTVLGSLNRHQKASDVHWLLTAAQGQIKALSVDLILGLPGISIAEWEELIHEVVTWPIQHMSIYFLTVHEDTPLYYGVTRKKIHLPTDDAMVALYEWTAEFVERHGFIQYEVSSFAQAGYESRHNRVYWQRLPYKGFGMGACSFDGASRFQNEKNLMAYLTAVESAMSYDELSPLTIFEETLTERQVWLEQLMLGLRQRQGLWWSELTRRLSPQAFERFRHKVTDFVALGYLEADDERCWLTRSGRAVEHELVVALIE